MRLFRKLQRLFWNHIAAWCVLFRSRDRAIDFYQKMLAIDQNDSLALASLGYQYAQLGRNRDALEMFDRLVLLDPDNAEAHFNRGFLLQQLNNSEAAIAALRRVIDINPNHDRALYGLALSLIADRRLDDAVPLLKRNTKLQPMSPFGWYQLARVEHELGRHEEAQRIVDHLHRFEPKVARQLARETGLKATENS